MTALTAAARVRCASNTIITGEEVWLPLCDAEERPFAEIELSRNASAARPGDCDARKAPCRRRREAKTEPEAVHRLYELSHARHVVQKARKRAGIGSRVTMDACRHRGMTEREDAEATDQEIMSASAIARPMPLASSSAWQRWASGVS